jgi:hypothetical protein
MSKQFDTASMARPRLQVASNYEDVKLAFSYLSGPESERIDLLISPKDYAAIVDGILARPELIDALVRTWVAYADALQDYGPDAEPPLGTYHADLMALCDPVNSGRAAMVAAIFGEFVEADAIYLHLTRTNSPLLGRFDVVDRTL